MSPNPKQPSKKKKKVSTPPPPPPYEYTTNPKLVDRLAFDFVHESLCSAWQINPDRPMCLIFDCVNPARQFKRGTPYNADEGVPFLEYDGDVTEADEDDEVGLQPYQPVVPECVQPIQHS